MSVISYASIQYFEEEVQIRMSIILLQVVNISDNIEAESNMMFVTYFLKLIKV